MNHYSAHIELNARDLTATNAESLLEALAAYSPAVGNSPRGWIDAQITVPADNLAQATQTAIAVVTQATGHEPLHVEVMTEQEFDKRQGFESLPELIGATDAAAMLGVSRQYVLQLIDKGELQSQIVGKSAVLARAEVEARAAKRHAAESSEEPVK